MKYWIGFVVLGFISVSGFAVPPQVSLDSMQPGENGAIKLNFTINGKKLSLNENDGGGTLATVTYILIQKVADDIHYGRVKWDNIKDKKIEGWAAIGPLMKESIARLFAPYAHLVDDTKQALKENPSDPELKANLRRYTDALAGIKKMQGQVSNFPAEGPSYAQLNFIGNWLDEYGDIHSYDGDVETDAGIEHRKDMPLLGGSPKESPIVEVLADGIKFTLPPSIRSNSKADIEGDLKIIINRYNAARVAKGKNNESQRRSTH